MTWNLNGKEFETVAHLAPKKRYTYFIKKVADRHEIWSLWNDGWVLMGDKDKKEIVPVWPHPIFAEAYAIGEWFGYKPKKITLEEWLTTWTAGMEKDHRMVAIFPTIEGGTITTSPLNLKNDLEAELGKYIE